MLIGQREFQPRIWSILLTLFGVALFVTLGNWQLDRAAYKADIIDRYEQRMSLPVQDFDPRAAVEAVEFSRVRVHGHFDPDHHFLVDNEIHQGQAGYRLLTPFRIAGSGRMILVDRGWLPLGHSRDQLPLLKDPLSRESIEGIVTAYSAEGFRFGETRLTESWPQLIPYIDLAALHQQFSTDLLPLLLRLAPDQPGHYIRAWHPVWAAPEKSRAYAVQWFSFAVLAVILFFILNLRKVE